ncbi:medium-chain fatty acid-CoA ligase faa2 [Coemansia javaensis]|uniref:Medium-chain fatty acid-CoA ligase faa2 n=1 Tax=Coemansia javaensis TaxID=2761396 RepID=A0A9W8HBG9_9FUNG|nr:medium-chain fatty acid-CoA ligase faa2 [Coemansia javaensis]
MRSYLVPGSAEPGFSAIMRHPASKDGRLVDEHGAVTTVYELFHYAVAQDPERRLIGRRAFDPATRTFGEYEWTTSREAAQAVAELAAGLDQVYERHAQAGGGAAGLPYAHQQGLGLYSINRPEWLLADFAAQRMGRYSVALYDTLGADAVEHVVRHAGLQVVACSVDKIPRLLRLRARLPTLRAIVSMDALAGRARSPAALPFTAGAVHVLREWAAAAGVALLDVDEVAAMGRAAPRAARPPRPDDLCTICYTSGTTGDPKGAMVTHGAYAHSVRAGAAAAAMPAELHLSFLPLAHCYERNTLLVGLLRGGRVGFYSGDVLRIADDAQALRPTVLLGVPRLFNRIYDRIAAETVRAPGLRGVVARAALRQKTARLEAGGGVRHALWDRVLCDKIRAFFGGRLEMLISGSAPLDPHVLSFLRVALAAVVREGYGSTECNGAATVSVPDEHTAGHVGVPFPGVDVRLRDVPDMGYRATDRPLPRGEVLVRTPHTFAGYYRDEPRTLEAYDAGGWLVTGDIGQFTADGNLQIIDRRKNILKLAQGEYVAVEYLETVYSRHRLVQTIFVHGDSLQSFLVAVVVPEPDEFLPWARAIAGPTTTTDDDDSGSLPALCRSPAVVRALLDELAALGRSAGLQGFEIVRAIHCEPTPFDIETNGLLTATLKIRRTVARDHYRRQIDKMYAEGGRPSSAV